MADTYPDDVFDILEALKTLVPNTAAGFARGTGGVDAPFIVKEIQRATPTPTAEGEVVGWRDIASAPKDGTSIIGCDETGHRFITRWTDDAYTAQCGSGGPAGWFSGRYHDHWGDRPNMDAPTQWQPLPAAPSTGNGKVQS